MKLYRGFNNNYPKTLGVRPEQKGVWLTDDFDYALEYANMFKNGAVVEVELDDNANIANEYECMSVFEDDEDWQDMAEYICDLGGDTVMDNQVCNKLADCGYDGVMFDDSGVDCYYVFNKDMIKDSKVIKKTYNNKEDAMESLNKELILKESSLNLSNINYTQLIKNVFNQIKKYGIDDLLIFNACDILEVLENNPVYYKAVAKALKTNDITDDYEEEMIEYIGSRLNNPKSVACQILYEMVENKFEIVYETLLDEIDDNLIYRKISTSKDINEIIEYSKQNGTGVCWAKQIENAETYAGDAGKDYILVGELTNENINLVGTIIARMICEEEDEIRLKANSQIKLIKIIDEMNKEYDINQVFNTGKSENYYQFNESKKKLNEGLANKPVSFTAYHGGVEPDMTPDEGRAFYLTDDYDLAHQFALREVYDVGLYEGEIPTIFTYKGTFNNPYFLTDDEYNLEGQDSNIDYEKWVEMGVDGLVYEGQGGSTYYIVIDLSTIKLVDKKVYWEEEIKDDDDIEESVNNSMLNVLLESNILTEDIAAVKKYFPKVPEDKIQTLIELDPTYQGGDNLGKFGKWILGLYNKGQLKDEDFYKVPQYLTTFKDNLKKIQNKDIMSYKTLPDLAQAIQPYEGQKDVFKKQQVKQLKSDEAEKVLETGNWLIVHPKTHKADCYYGANTKWCTASKDDDTWFDEYNDKGPLFILINKNNNEKFQFHFQTQSFMNELDKPEFPQLIISNDSEVIKWFKQYAFENIDNIIEEYNENNWDAIDFGGSTGYAYRVDITDILNFCVQFSESNLALKKIITMFYEELELEGFGSKLIYKLFESDEEFKDKCDKLVAEYSPHDYFIKTYHYKTTGLFTDKDFRQMLFRKLRDSVYNDLARPLLDKIINEIVEIDEDDNSFYIEFDENELVNSLYQWGDFRNCKEKLRISSEGNRVNFSDLGITTDEFLKDTVIKAIKEYFEGNDDQMEFDFAAESVMKYKNPFLED